MAEAEAGMGHARFCFNLRVGGAVAGSKSFAQRRRSLPGSVTERR